MESRFSFSVLPWVNGKPLEVITITHADVETCLTLALNEAEITFRKGADRVTMFQNHNSEIAKEAFALNTKVG